MHYLMSKDKRKTNLKATIPSWIHNTIFTHDVLFRFICLIYYVCIVLYCVVLNCVVLYCTRHAPTRGRESF